MIIWLHVELRILIGLVVFLELVVLWNFTLDLVLAGVGYHHAGMDMEDRKLIEATFAGGDMAVLGESAYLEHVYHKL